MGLHRLPWLWLDLVALPGALVRLLCDLVGDSRLGLELNARWHLWVVCPFCPAARRRLRDPSGGTRCMWAWWWSRGRWEIPPHFGFRNLLTQYLGRTELDEHAWLEPPDDGGWP